MEKLTDTGKRTVRLLAATAITSLEQGALASLHDDYYDAEEKTRLRAMYREYAKALRDLVGMIAALEETE